MVKGFYMNKKRRQVAVINFFILSIPVVHTAINFIFYSFHCFTISGCKSFSATNGY